MNVLTNAMELEKIMEYLPFIIPIIIIEWILLIVALVHCLRHDKYKFGNRVLWVLLILFVQIIGPILYLTIGRSEE